MLKKFIGLLSLTGMLLNATNVEVVVPESSQTITSMQESKVAVPVSSDYYTKVSPFQEYVLKSDISGKILSSATELETKRLTDTTVIIKIDATTEQIDLELMKKKLAVLQQLTELKLKDTEMVKSSYSVNDFDKRAKQQTYLNALLTKYEVESSIKRLEDTIKRKTITLPKGTYLKNVNVVKDDYVTPGTKLLTYSDIGKVKLIIYVSKEDYVDIEKKKVYINDKYYPEYKVSKKSLLKDDNKLSSFEIMLVGIQNGFMFGDLVKVSFK
jgi:hypothetical protein